MDGNDVGTTVGDGDGADVGTTDGDGIGAEDGAPLGDGAPDWSGLTAVVEGHMAEHDDFFPTQAVLALGDDLRAMGRDVTFHVYDGTGHPFANEEDPFGTYDADAAALAWSRTLALLDAHL